MQESDDGEGPPPFANRMKGMTASEIRELLKILDQPDVISFAGGIPDPALFPVAEIDRFSPVAAYWALPTRLDQRCWELPCLY